MIDVLIVDDHAVLRSGLRLLIDSEPDMQTVGEAGDGASALKQAMELHPDVVLMDITLPDMNGIEVIRRIKQNDDLDCDILVLTMHPETNYLRPALDVGASGYVVKSMADDELLDAIRAVYKGHSFLSTQAVATLIDDRPPEGTPQAVLSAREIEVLKLVAHGYTNAEIGEQLYLSPKTIDTYRRRMMRKLGLETRADVVDYALKYGLLRRYRGLEDET